MGLLHYRDPATGNWVPLSTQGPAGPQGPVGPEGPPGDAEEVWVGPNAPVGNNFELWLDTDDTGAAPVDPATVFLSKSGGAMSGPLLLAGDPQAAKEAATRDYVEAHRAGRNGFINPACFVNQRGCWSGAPATKNTAFIADHWRLGGGASDTTVGYPFSPQPGELPFFGNILAIDVKGQVDGAADMAEYCVLTHQIEYGLRRYQGKDVTVSFWARTDTPGSFKIGVELLQLFKGGTGAETPSPFVSTALGAKTIGQQWARYSVSGHVPSTQGKNDNGLGTLMPHFWLSAGRGWGARPAGVGVQNWVVLMTGFQIEEGLVATDFEDVPLSQQYDDCQRFYRIGTWTGAICAGSPVLAYFSHDMSRYHRPPTVTCDSITLAHNGAQVAVNPTLVVNAADNEGYAVLTPASTPGAWVRFNGIKFDAEIV